jgi:hypothetical protein
MPDGNSLPEGQPHIRPVPRISARRNDDIAAVPLFQFRNSLCEIRVLNRW